MVTFGSYPVNCYKSFGLDAPQWFICIAFGMLGNIWRVILSKIPDTVVPLVGPLKKMEQSSNTNRGLGIKGNQDQEVQQRRNNPMR